MDDTSVRIKQELRSMNERLKKLDPVLSITKDSVQDLTSQLAKTSQQLSSSLKSALGGSQGSGQAVAIPGLAGLESAVTSLSSQLPGLVGATISLWDQASSISLGMSTLSSNISSFTTAFTSQISGNQFTADELASKIAKAISDEKDKDLPPWVKELKDSSFMKGANGVAELVKPFSDILGAFNTTLDFGDNVKEILGGLRNEDQKSVADLSKNSKSVVCNCNSKCNCNSRDSESDVDSSDDTVTTSDTVETEEKDKKKKKTKKTRKKTKGKGRKRKSKSKKKKNRSGKSNNRQSIDKGELSAHENTKTNKPPTNTKPSNVPNLQEGKGKSWWSLGKGKFAKRAGITSLAGTAAMALFTNSDTAQAAADKTMQSVVGQQDKSLAVAAQTAINTVQTGRDLAATASTASSALSWTKKILTGAKVVNKVSRFARFTPMGLIGGFALDAGIYAAEKWLLPKLEKNTKKEEELTEEQIRKNAEQMRAFKEAANQAASTSNPGFHHTIPPTFGTLPASSNVPTPSPATTPAQGQNTTDASPEPSAPRPQPHPGMLATPPAATFSTKPYTSMGTPMEPVSAPPAANSNASARTIPQTVDVNANSQVVMNLNVNGYIDRKMIEEIKRICREQYESAFRSFERGITSKVPLPPPVNKGGMMSY